MSLLTIFVVLSLTSLQPALAAEFKPSFDPAIELPPGSVYVSTENLSPEDQAMLDYVAGMDLDEINAFISETANRLQSTGPSSRLSVGELQLLWLAAAQAARIVGYPLAATLIECSVFNTSCSEYNGQFSSAIKNTSAYSAWTHNISTTSIGFEKYDNADLFYSLHLVNTRVKSSGSQGAIVEVTDVFDFEFIKEMDSIFTTLVNDWAWLCQQTGVLHRIGVLIQFNA